MTKLITATQFQALSKDLQLEYVNLNGYEFAEEVTGNTKALFNEPDAEVPVAIIGNEYDIEGDAVFANIVVTVAGTAFRIKGVKLTEKRNCMDRWDKESKKWTTTHNDTMSLIEMVRTHGAETVNAHSTAEVTFGKAGERNETTRDPIAELLAKPVEVSA